MNEKFIITIKAENRPGLVGQITALLNRKQLNMESMSAAKTDISSVIMISIELMINGGTVRPLIHKLQNIIEIYGVDVVNSSESVAQRVAYFKLSKELLNTPQCAVLKKSGLQLINFNRDAILLSKAGNENEIRLLYNQLEGPHLLGFMQSGLITDTLLIDNDDVRVTISTNGSEALSVMTVAA
jgi:acetolactate synthase-1/3 small subunit